MDKYQNQCVACLCNDRKLEPLIKMKNILEYIHFTELKPWKGAICWECKNTILKFYKFKHKVVQAQYFLSLKKVKNVNPLTTLGIKVNVPYNYHYNDNNPRIEMQIKEEIEDLDNNLSDSENKIKTELELSEHDYVKPNNIIGENIDSAIVIFDVKDLQRKIIETIVPSCSSSQINIEDRLKIDTAEEYSDKLLKVIQTEEEMIIHREYERSQHNHNKMPFKCDFCVIEFEHKEKYDAHMQSKHDELQSIGPYACQICNIRFESMSSLEVHEKIHNIYYRCKFCQYTTSLQFSMLVHCKEQHEKDADEKIHCEHCDAVLRNVHELEEHVQTEHDLYCNVCGLKYISPSSLKQHKSRVHSTKREFICDVCKKTFTTKSRLETHMTKHSALIAKNMSYCSECKVQFKSLGIYRNHIRTSSQHAKNTFPCSKCDKRFLSEAYLKRHYGYMHVRNAKHYCKACDKSFMLPYQLRNHNQVHHGLSRSRDHACDECGKEFFTPNMLRNHQQIHSKNRSHMCAHCGDTFKQRAALYTHTKLVHKLGGKKRIK